MAQELANPPSGVTSPAEARQRAAIGRAYYAVFGRALQVFVALGEYSPRKTAEDHEALAKLLAASPEKRRHKIGEALHRMRPARRWADYDIDAAPQKIGIKSGGPACNLAQQTIETIESVLTNPL